ncbi:MAG: 50S ribosomal protein L13 [candidate division WOR-3 bacterium]|nr:50S ribosomal protein L13 [candidate division WOR-3 bacterium]MDW7987437.1 50S ribosomal protein L13 [candidate division WOR-3 bacterium]
MKSYIAKPQEIERKWYLVDAQGKTLGRFASQIARILMGKDKPHYTPHLDLGDFVVVINAEKIRVTGKKYTDKIYYHHSGYPGGLKAIRFKDLLAKFPERIIELAVKRMLPKNRLRAKRMRRLLVYRGPEHPHQAQNPVLIQDLVLKK